MSLCCADTCSLALPNCYCSCKRGTIRPTALLHTSAALLNGKQAPVASGSIASCGIPGPKRPTCPLPGHPRPAMPTNTDLPGPFPVEVHPGPRSTSWSSRLQRRREAVERISFAAEKIFLAHVTAGKPWAVLNNTEVSCELGDVCAILSCVIELLYYELWHLAV